jgi:hypothetical protein
VRYSSKHPRERTTAGCDRQDGSFSSTMKWLSLQKHSRDLDLQEAIQPSSKECDAHVDVIHNCDWNTKYTKD